jgi:hypothetical protein
MARASAAAPAPAVVVPGAKDHQMPGWISTEPTGIAFLDEIRERHLVAVGSFAERCEVEREAVRAQRAGQEEHRDAVRHAVAAGQEPPAAPDPTVAEAKVSVAREDVRRAEGTLAEIAVEALGGLRKRRTEVEPVMARFSPALRRSLQEGPGGRASARVAEIRAELAQLEGPAIETITDDVNEEVEHVA